MFAKLNDLPINQHCLKLLDQLKYDPAPNRPHCLSLLQWAQDRGDLLTQDQDDAIFALMRLPADRAIKMVGLDTWTKVTLDRLQTPEAMVDEMAFVIEMIVL